MPACPPMNACLPCDECLPALRRMPACSATQPNLYKLPDTNPDFTTAMRVGMCCPINLMHPRIGYPCGLPPSRHPNPFLTSVARAPLPRLHNRKLCASGHSGAPCGPLPALRLLKALCGCLAHNAPPTHAGPYLREQAGHLQAAEGHPVRAVWPQTQAKADAHLKQGLSPTHTKHVLVPTNLEQGPAPINPKQGLSLTTLRQRLVPNNCEQGPAPTNPTKP
eukprot:358247-Chlamydomonas_euryale.AAC.10